MAAQRCKILCAFAGGILRVNAATIVQNTSCNTKEGVEGFFFFFFLGGGGGGEKEFFCLFFFKVPVNGKGHTRAEYNSSNYTSKYDSLFMICHTLCL